MIHPDLRQRRDGNCAAAHARGLLCFGLGTSVITLSTGTRDPQNMWRRHPDNDTPEAWRDLLAAIREAVPIAEENQSRRPSSPRSQTSSTRGKGTAAPDEVRSPNLKGGSRAWRSEGLAQFKQSGNLQDLIETAPDSARLVVRAVRAPAPQRRRRLRLGLEGRRDMVFSAIGTGLAYRREQVPPGFRRVVVWVAAPHVLRIARARRERDHGCTQAEARSRERAQPRQCRPAADAGRDESC